MVPDADYRIKLQVFEGPLDLLLFLIRKNELDIYDIPIESVTRQYIDALHAMRRLRGLQAGEARSDHQDPRCASHVRILSAEARCHDRGQTSPGVDAGELPLPSAR